MGSIKDRNSMDLTEAENIKKRWQEYRELYKKRSSWPRWSWWCDHSPRARHPGLWSQVGLSKHPNISSSVIPFSSRLQFFQPSGSFQMSQFFPSGGQSIGVLDSTSVLPMNIQDWFPLGWAGWISLQSKGLSRSSPTPQLKIINSSVLSFLYSPTLTSIHDHQKNHSLD